MDFADKRVLVTGSSRGIGLATARAFLEEGARVAVNGRTEGSSQAAVAQLGPSDRLHAAPGDVATAAGCASLVARALDALGGLDVLINNAGIYEGLSIEESDEPLWDAIMDVNVKGTFFCSQSALPALRRAEGVIVNVASDAGLRGFRRMSVYCASKGAVVNLTRAMAIELAPGVRVNCVCPGDVDTDMVRRYVDAAADPETYRKSLEAAYPMQRIATADEVAQAILYLASQDARFVTGAALPLDGGLTAGS